MAALLRGESDATLTSIRHALGKQARIAESVGRLRRRGFRPADQRRLAKEVDYYRRQQAAGFPKGPWWPQVPEARASAHLRSREDDWLAWRVRSLVLGDPLWRAAERMVSTRFLDGRDELRVAQDFWKAHYRATPLSDGSGPRP